MSQGDGLGWSSGRGLIQGKKLFCLVDGEHYPPVIHWTLEALTESGGKIVGALFLGGTEKVDDVQHQLTAQDRDYPFYFPDSKAGKKFDAQFLEALREVRPDLVVDLSDEPVVDSRRRLHLASISLAAGVSYVGSDYYFSPPSRERILTKPSLAIIGSGKRVGKTAVSVTVARLLRKEGYRPLIVSMGRGGPPEPEVLLPETMDRSPEFLISLAKHGMHAASDYREDAILAGVPTVGCRRCGGGMTGSPFLSNVLDGANVANQLEGDFVIMEGSGPTIPPVFADNNILVIGAGQPLENITGYLNEYKIRTSDLAIITGSEQPIAGKEKRSAIQHAITEINPNLDVLFTVFRPQPLGDITRRRVFIATTSPKAGRTGLQEYLETQFDCTVTGLSTNLSNRQALRRDLKQGLEGSEVLLTEIKAASIDVAARLALEHRKEIVFLHNQPRPRGGTMDELRKSILSVCKRALTKVPS